MTQSIFQAQQEALLLKTMFQTKMEPLYAPLIIFDDSFNQATDANKDFVNLGPPCCIGHIYIAAGGQA